MCRRALWLVTALATTTPRQRDQSQDELPTNFDDISADSINVSFLEAYQLCLQWHVNALVTQLGCDAELDTIVAQLWFRYLETRATNLNFVQSYKRRKVALRKTRVRRRRRTAAATSSASTASSGSIGSSQRAANDDDDDDNNNDNAGAVVIQPTKEVVVVLACVARVQLNRNARSDGTRSASRSSTAIDQSTC